MRVVIVVCCREIERVMNLVCLPPEFVAASLQPAVDASHSDLPSPCLKQEECLSCSSGG